MRFLYPITHNVRRFTTANTLKVEQKATRGWRKYVQQFRDKPASYVTTFAILHEVTAIIPFPFIYYALDASALSIPVSETAITEGNRFISKVRVHYGYEPLDPQSRVMINLATTYAAVKLLMPVRLAASAALTPFFAEKWVGPLVGLISRLGGKIRSPKPKM
ncbi:hypothetical protein J3Q64DRAFT_1744132 [Phycomyces blakesleeanus]|uniref:Uncharacterized protein n=2 Tax=Phycomyces blakesleeanus TaxID=4837 RepID=A0A162NDT5_PHYB8|nr:hypothetical protein PHYBLDRAFT_145784 [Phycomyces blakesleeanus NRRL 1555(-)]OAD73388.1 hypothetical protein PHYBLDRAFT_145784 [Phycomyces blakesleeanus NRRL 1555(-)]|eukprot:XP_018291428.1 hypothetical protein PHYBLDRAFT_145784 [Phycomyces blakesleeanus NRRL 1555(-)]